MIKSNWQKVLFVVFSFFSPLIPAYGKTQEACPQGKICNPLNNASDITGFVQQVLTGLLRIGIPIIAIAVIYSGFLFVAARGNSEKLSKAKASLLYTLIGAAILLGSWSIALLIKATVDTL